MNSEHEDLQKLYDDGQRTRELADRADRKQWRKHYLLALGWLVATLALATLLAHWQ